MGGFHLNLIQNLPPVYKSPSSLPSPISSLPSVAGACQHQRRCQHVFKGLGATHSGRPHNENKWLSIPVTTPDCHPHRDTHAELPPPATLTRPHPARHLPPGAARQVNVSSAWGKASQHLSTFSGFPQTFPLSGLSFTHFSSPLCSLITLCLHFSRVVLRHVFLRVLFLIFLLTVLTHFSQTLCLPTPA